MTRVLKGNCKKASLEYKSQFLIWLSTTKDRAKSFNNIRFSYNNKEGDIGFLSRQTYVYQGVKICGCPKKYLTNSTPTRDLQRPRT